MSETTQSGRDLLEAVQNNKYDTVERLVDSTNANTSDHHGRNLLYFAALNKNYDICMLLLENEASVDMKDINRWNALSVAVSKGYKQICELLLKKNPDVNVQDDKELTPLMIVASKGDQQICQLLLKKGAEVNLIDKDGCSALMKAVVSNKMDVCKCLLDHGADIDLKNNDEKTALDISYSDVKYAQINDMLKAHSIIRKKKEILKEREEYEKLKQLCNEREKRNTEIAESIEFLRRQNGETNSFLEKPRTKDHLYNVLLKRKPEYEKNIKELSDEIRQNESIIAKTKSKIKSRTDQLREEINRLENCFERGEYEDIA